MLSSSSCLCVRLLVVSPPVRFISSPLAEFVCVVGMDRRDKKGVRVLHSYSTHKNAVDLIIYHRRSFVRDSVGTCTGRSTGTRRSVDLYAMCYPGALPFETTTAHSQLSSSWRVPSLSSNCLHDHAHSVCHLFLNEGSVRCSTWCLLRNVDDPP